MTTALQVTDLHKEYPTPTQPLVVLRGINLTLNPGDSLAILGPSGSGKSTLLNILGTLDIPTSGQFTLNDINPFSLNPASLAKFRSQNIGFVFQDHHLLPQLTALENILLTKLASGKVTPDDIQRAKDLLQKVGLTDRASHFPSELSGGERQRIAIARALMNQPTLLLADEPTGNLDSKTSATIGQLLLDLATQTNAIIITVTHSAALASLFNTQLHMTDGQLVRQGKRGDL
ncbi:MAG TPA: ABC transporter ATP-binding protein [Tepidisphaeraceae bacterium]|jgi:lipoprotein-releasing system ATP-binding protein|nr:ABC transporter ATP-binding protein [Tepidisphaeraceae bacterium]